ncbi:uncharacterized protein LOC26528035 [Drosophila mojavensis]|uniref:Uncharacterized protein n=1 Tax=Drosophila mojavensis TaxID=7230 RepID=A0A0Q9X4V7_DROMO|nr:uncharacterized protein LOC26528035 [Drosophila mojavensis]KRG03099.1 uncharacterized protein Dmoj_GI26394 [Drosophila mojavensis]
MVSNSIIISCAVLAIIFVAYLPLGDAVTCTVEPDNVDCVDCLEPINIDNSECIAEDYEDDDALATRRPPRWDRPGRRPGRRRRGPGHGHRHGHRQNRQPQTLLGRILQKKLSIINGIKQG